MKIYRISKNTVNINVAIQKAKDITPLLMQDIEELKKPSGYKKPEVLHSLIHIQNKKKQSHSR